MAGWLSAAARAFGRTAEEPESLQYSVVCACGRAATGERRGEWQRTQCTSCGEILFVLPKNVYPRAKPAGPVAPKKPPAPPARRPASNETSEPSVKQAVAEAPAEPARSRTKEAKRPAPAVT